MVEGTGQLAGAAAKTFFGNPANFHFESERKKDDRPCGTIHYKPPLPPVNMCFRVGRRTTIAARFPENPSRIPLPCRPGQFTIRKNQNL
jgi:hypothetical protein